MGEWQGRVAFISGGVSGLGLGIVRKIAGKDGIALDFGIANDRAEVTLRF